MRIIVPKTITDSVLVSSNVPETDYAAWSSATAYAVGDYCMLASLHRVYICLVANTNKQPDQNLTGTTPPWQEVGYTNRWRAFDPYVNTLTTKSDGIDMVLDAGSCDSIALFNLAGSSVTLELKFDGVVMDSQTFPLAFRNVVSWKDFFFAEFQTKSDIRASFPLYWHSQIHITINGNASCGNVVLGRTTDIGGTVWDAKVGIMDFSKKVRDENFGNTFLQQGAYSKRGSIGVEIRNEKIDYVYKVLASLRGKGAAYICDNDSPQFECMQIFGFYRDFDVTISGPTRSKCTLELEGLI